MTDSAKTETARIPLEVENLSGDNGDPVGNVLERPRDPNQSDQNDNEGSGRPSNSFSTDYARSHPSERVAILLMQDSEGKNHTVTYGLEQPGEKAIADKYIAEKGLVPIPREKAANPGDKKLDLSLLDEDDVPKKPSIDPDPEGAWNVANLLPQHELARRIGGDAKLTESGAHVKVKRLNSDIDGLGGSDSTVDKGEAGRSGPNADTEVSVPSNSSHDSDGKKKVEAPADFESRSRTIKEKIDSVLAARENRKQAILSSEDFNVIMEKIREQAGDSSGPTGFEMAKKVLDQLVTKNLANPSDLNELFKYIDMLKPTESTDAA